MNKIYSKMWFLLKPALSENFMIWETFSSVSSETLLSQKAHKLSNRPIFIVSQCYVQKKWERKVRETLYACSDIFRFPFDKIQSGNMIRIKMQIEQGTKWTNYTVISISRCFFCEVKHTHTHQRKTESQTRTPYEKKMNSIFVYFDMRNQ